MVWIQLTLQFNNVCFNHFQPVTGENVKKRNQNKLTYSLYSKVVIGLKPFNETNTVISIASSGSQRIKVLSANYGRTDKRTCAAGRPAKQVTKTNCILPKTLSVMAERLA